MKHYSADPNMIENFEIGGGRFEGFLFFDGCGPGLSHHCYELDDDAANLVSPYHLAYGLDDDDIEKLEKNIIPKIVECCSVSKSEAWQLLCCEQYVEICDESSAELSWDVQILIGKAALDLGYNGVCFDGDDGDMVFITPELLKKIKKI